MNPYFNTDLTEQSSYSNTQVCSRVESNFYTKISYAETWTKYNNTRHSYVPSTRIRCIHGVTPFGDNPHAEERKILILF